MSITCKFGGSALAEAAQARRAFAIIKANPERRCIVVSAPGKRPGVLGDKKVTDLFQGWHAIAHLNISTNGQILEKIEERYLEIARGLGLELDLSIQFRTIAERLSRGASLDYAMSRGEYLMGIVLANALGFAHIDPYDCIFLHPTGRCDRARTKMSLVTAMGRAGGRAVISGFYGRCSATGEIKTFPRGGSDITGGEVAAALNASLYENWSDKNGMRMADPGIVPGARKIELTSYRLAREFGLRGVAEEFIFHPAATLAVEDADIPTRIRDTNDPRETGTLLSREVAISQHPILGVTGRRACHLIEVYRRASDEDIGDIHRATGVLVRNGVPLRHMSTGTESFSLIVYSSDVGSKGDEIERQIKAECEADYVGVLPEASSVVTVVGPGLKGVPGTLARFAGALGKKGISIATTDQGASELSFTFSVRPEDYRAAVVALYNEAITP